MDSDGGLVKIAPEAAQGNQINQIGNTWGTRMKVRIYGYHPADLTELADEDLPWAQVLLSPQCGSGKANRARSLRVSPGDTVIGFFLMVMMHNFLSSWEYLPALLIIMVAMITKHLLFHLLDTRVRLNLIMIS